MRMTVDIWFSLQMETNLARYQGSASQLLKKVRREVPLPAAELSGHNQGKPIPSVVQDEQPKMKLADGPRVKGAVDRTYGDL